MENNNNNNKKFVSGPINVIRLEGEVFGIKKILYVFLDHHDAETECEYFRSDEISKYFTKNFDEISKGDKIYDFFLEIPIDLLDKKIYITERNYQHYIFSLIKLFKQSFEIDLEKNIIGRSNEFPNIRLHYLDTRQYTINSYSTSFSINHNINHLNINTLSTYILKYHQDGLTINIAEVKNTYDMLYSNKLKKIKHKPLIPKNAEDLANYNEEEMIKISSSLYNKLLNEYHHYEIKNTITNIINNELKLLFDNFFEICNNIIKLLPKFDSILSIKSNELTLDLNINEYNYGNSQMVLQNIIIKLIADNNIRNILNIKIYAFIMDLFFIRRLLDKDYITNGIIYTGSAHSFNYIYIFVKYFNFKITHCSYLKKGETISKVEEFIKTTSEPQSLSPYFKQQKLSQCSDMTNFPKFFK